MVLCLPTSCSQTGQALCPHWCNSPHCVPGGNETSHLRLTLVWLQSTYHHAILLPERLKNSSGGGPADHKPCHICVEARWNGHELGKTPRSGEGKGSLVCCSPCGCEELDMTWQPKNNRATESQGTWGRILTALFPGCVTSKKILTSLNCLLCISCGWYCSFLTLCDPMSLQGAFPSL